MTEYNFVEKIIGSLDIHIFAKDRLGRFTFVNENFAKAADMESPDNMIGKRDHDTVWGSQGDYFRKSDLKTMQGNLYIKVPEIQIRNEGAKTIFTSKNILRDCKNNVAGIVGSFIQYDGKTLVNCMGTYDPDKKRVMLGKQFSNEYLTCREIEVYYFTLLGKSAPQISKTLNRSSRTVEFHLIQLKRKLQCSTVGELIATAITTGLTHTLFSAMSFSKNVN